MQEVVRTASFTGGDEQRSSTSPRAASASARSARRPSSADRRREVKRVQDADRGRHRSRTSRRPSRASWSGLGAARPGTARIARGWRTSGPVLELRGITKRFPGIVANDHVDFDLRQGEVHALLGENGAGKSTLMNVLYGLYHPDEGEILINGKPVRARLAAATAIERGIGMVHQHFMLIPVMTVAENIVLATEPTHRRRPARLRRGARARRASSRSASASPSTRARTSRTSPSASSSASRS